MLCAAERAFRRQQGWRPSRCLGDKGLRMTAVGVKGRQVRMCGCRNAQVDRHKTSVPTCMVAYERDMWGEGAEEGVSSW